jgi:hypothetical protein
MDIVVGTNHKWNKNASICCIPLVALIINTNPQSPLSNLFLKVTPKLIIHIYDPTFKWSENVITKTKFTIKVIVKYSKISIKSQCMYLKPLPNTL